MNYEKLMKIVQLWVLESPENVTFIPGGSVESVKLLAAPSPDQIPMPPFVGMDQHKKEMKTVVGLSTGTSSTCSPSIRSATPSVCGDFVYDSDCRDGLQKSFKTMFCPPCPASEEVMMSTGSTMKRSFLIPTES
jgi:hypothetical protein